MVLVVEVHAWLQILGHLKEARIKWVAISQHHPSGSKPTASTKTYP